MFLTYLLSFVMLGIYWNNHHHMFHLVDRVAGSILWANLHLLFWLSLIPFVTGWMGESHFESLPTSAYGIVLLMAALAWTVLQRRIIASARSSIATSLPLSRDAKGWASVAAYVLAIPLAFVDSRIAHALYVLVALPGWSPTGGSRPSSGRVVTGSGSRPTTTAKSLSSKRSTVTRRTGDDRMNPPATYKPEGYSSVSPYLIVDGADRTIDFLVRVFDAEEPRRFPDAEGKLMHAEVRIAPS